MYIILDDLINLKNMSIKTISFAGINEKEVLENKTEIILPFSLIPKLISFPLCSKKNKIV